MGCTIYRRVTGQTVQVRKEPSQLRSTSPISRLFVRSVFVTELSFRPGDSHCKEGVCDTPSPRGNGKDKHHGERPGARMVKEANAAKAVTGPGNPVAT